MSDKDITTQEKVNQVWDAMAEEWDALASSYADGFYNLIWKHTSLNPESKTQLDCITDFGCGTGLLTEKLRRVAAHVLAIEASPKMAAQVNEKVNKYGWKNVTVAPIVLSSFSKSETSAKQAVEDVRGNVDLVVASSVLSFVPAEDVKPTLEQLGTLLKPGALLCHSDWPKSPEHPDGLDKEKATSYYAMAGLETVSMVIEQINMGEGECVDVFVGVAKKPQN